MTRKPFLRTLGQVLIVLVFTSLLPAGWPGSSTPAHAAEARTVELGVEGMTCASCTFAVKSALRKIDGVAAAKVSFRDKSAVVTYDPERVTPEDLVSAVAATGFTASAPESAGKCVTRQEFEAMSDCCSVGLCSSKTYLRFQRQDGSPWTPMYVQEVDPETCIGCGKCLQVCMGGCYEMVEIAGEKKARVVNPGNCMGDCHCHKVCPVAGGAMTCRPVEVEG